jgi:AcrR family transcriptional regulator
MAQDKATVKRPRGRPSLRSEHETRQLLIKAAGDVFLTAGYSGTSIEAVARQAGMSTRTIYKTVKNKAQLFRLVADDAIQTSIANLETPHKTRSTEDAVVTLTRAYAHLVLGHDGVLKARAVYAEQTQFPEFRDDYLSSIQQVAQAFDRRFEAIFAQDSRLTKAQIQETANLLRNMINGAQREAILDPNYKGDAPYITAWSDRATRFALAALKTMSAVKD